MKYFDSLSDFSKREMDSNENTEYILQSDANLETFDS